MKEIVWVVGASASGKETFIRHVLTNKDIARQLGWSGKTVAACEASLTYIGQFDDDPVVEQRERIFSETLALLQEVDIVLIKWQYLDTLASRLERLRQLFPDIRHRIIELKAPLSELVDRLTRKPWWDESGKEEAYIQKEQKLISEITASLRDNFTITTLNSGVNGDYEVILLKSL